MKYQIYIDLGMSGTKAIFCNGVHFHPYLCPSKVADLPPSELQILKDQGTQFGGDLESEAYLQTGATVYALAEDANGRSNKTTALLRKKYAGTPASPGRDRGTGASLQSHSFIH
jgi:hypothetical protein